VFGRSIKLALTALVPVAVAYGVLAEPIVRTIYGPRFDAARVPLQLLAPAVLMISVVTLATSLIVSRDNPRRMVSLTALVVGINVVLNLILIPRFADAGAAAAMLATETVFVVVAMRLAIAKTGSFAWIQTLAGPLGAGAAMTAVTLALRGSPIPALVAGGAVYLSCLVAIELLTSPVDLNFVVTIIRRRLPSRLAG
jgi:PST family polysaccharide transporter